MRKTDINRYVQKEKNTAGAAALGALCSVGSVLKKLLLTIFTICMITGIIVSISVISFIWSIKDESVDYDLHKLKLNYTSFIYVNGEGDDPNNPVEYQALYSGENRVWVDFGDIPQYMKDAIICIEDKRYNEHQGVDWIRTDGAILNLFTGSSDSMYGGSTITQQHYDDCRQSSYTMTMFIQRSHEFRNNYTIKDKRLSVMASISSQEDKLSTIRLRDLGIPVTMDYNPAETVPTSNRRWSTPFDPRLFTKSYYEITQMGSGKFYRQTYAHNPIPAPTDREEHVPAFFRDPFQKDVTSIYLHTADVEIPVSLPAEREYAYLAMYNKEEWVPVAFAKAENGKCRFRDLGMDALYLPVHYPEGRMEALGAPFVLYCNGKTQAKGGTGERKKLCIERTEPYQGKFEYQGEEFPGSCFECDDNRNFQSADTVYIEKEILNYRLASTALASTPTARFWRFTPNSNYVVMAELHFINEKGQILQGKYIPEDANSTDLTDEDSQTFRIIEDALSIDFGKPVSVCGIEYMIFSGQGNVRNGHEYELFYFQEGAWHSAGKEKARNYRVVFDNVPAGSLYQVVDRTEETRGALFTQENGRIRYW